VRDGLPTKAAAHESTLSAFEWAPQFKACFI